MSSTTPLDESQSSLTERIQRELAFQSDKARESAEKLRPTDPLLIERYRVATDWRINRHLCVIKWLRQDGTQTIADFGCGSGEMAVRLAAMGHTVTGFDASPELIEQAHKRAKLDGVADRCTFEVCDFDGANLRNRNFDAVLAMSILHHLPIEMAVSTLKGLIRPGGHASILEPVAFCGWLQKIRDSLPVEKDVSPDERQLSHNDLAKLAEQLHFEKQRYFYLTQRLCRFFQPSKFPHLNQMLRVLDQWLLKLPGMNHFAGSVVILARRPVAATPNT
jgi:ubiquinone/menaquinone biosynthesis C-methylase UbiE